MAEKYLKKCSTFLVIREMQIQTILRFHLTPVRKAKIKNSWDSRYWQGCGERGTLLNCCWYFKLVNRSGTQSGGSSESWAWCYQKTLLWRNPHKDILLVYELWNYPFNYDFLKFTWSWNTVCADRHLFQLHLSGCVFFLYILLLNLSYKSYCKVVWF